jgi:glutamyl-tRNA(Gln) amidotransferase subunit D
MTMTKELTGYRGEARHALIQANVGVGDLVKVTRGGEVFEGVLMPRYELADDRHIVLKLKNGYNIGLRVDSNMVVERMGAGAKPTFTAEETASERKDLPTVVVISTGGTIASRVDYRTGAVHSALSASDLCTIVPELSDIANIRAEVLFSLFSENLHAPHWRDLAQRVAGHIDAAVDGVVICHGTDTLAYTSAALSFALQNLPVPVILVGSQRSSDRPSSDATINLINAVQAAARGPLAGVMVGMHDTTSDTTTVLHRGTKVRKCHTSRRDAFTSVNAEPLARIQGDTIHLSRSVVTTRDSDRQLVLKASFDEQVALLKFYPGFPPTMVRWLVENAYHGIVFEGTGLGHVAEALFPPLRYAAEHGLVLAMASQCVWGRINMNVYTTGMDLQKLGVLSLEDMLAETAVVKLMWALGQTLDPGEVKDLMLTNVAGEINERSIFRGFP